MASDTEIHVLLDKSRMGMCFSVYSQFSSSKKNFWECVVYICAPWDTFSFVSPVLIHCSISDVRWLSCTAVFSAEHWIYGEQNLGSSFSHFLLYFFSSELLASLLMAQLAIPGSFCRAPFSLVAYGYLTGGADTVQMRICLWVFSYFSFCESGCCIFY